jgi:diguanylate cyclase (GGDEF)-like protein
VIRTNARTNGHTHESAGFDALTGVWNRNGFVAAATPMFLSCRRRGAPMALAYFDFDAGDRSPAFALDASMDLVLMTMAEQMRGAFRATDIVGRVEPLRFAVLLTDCTDAALKAVEGVRVIADDARSSLGISLAVGMIRATSEADLEELMAAADLRAKAVKHEQGGANGAAPGS